MKDKLEQFLSDHRDDFNTREPREGVWSTVSDSLYDRRVISLWNSVSLWRAAAIVLMMVSGYLFVSNQGFGSSQPVGLQQEFSDIESFYSAQITEKAAFISNKDVFGDNHFTQDIKKLEAMYTVLAEEMRRNPTEKVKDALVLNMLVRIDLLNQQIKKLEDRGQTEKSTTVNG